MKLCNASLHHTWLGYDWYRLERYFYSINNKSKKERAQESHQVSTKTAYYVLHKSGIYGRAAIWKPYVSKSNAHKKKEDPLQEAQNLTPWEMKSSKILLKSIISKNNLTAKIRMSLHLEKSKNPFKPQCLLLAFKKVFVIV